MVGDADAIENPALLIPATLPPHATTLPPEKAKAQATATPQKAKAKAKTVPLRLAPMVLANPN